MSVSLKLRNIKTDYLLLFMIIASLNFYSFSWVDLKIYQYIHLVIFAILIFCTFFKKKDHSKNYYFHYKSILLMVALPLLSFYSCNVMNGQSYSQSLVVYRMHLGWLVYFYLWANKVSYERILKTVFIAGIIYMVITLGQQITFPFAPFGERTLGTNYSQLFVGTGVERRMGFYRFAVTGLYYGILAFFIVIDNRQKSKAILFCLLALSIIASGNRQTMFSVFVAVCFYYLFTNNVRYKNFIIIFIALSNLFVYLFADQIFGNLINVQRDMDEGRMPSYVFYWNEICRSPLTFLFGNGLSNGASEYGQRIDMLYNVRVTPSDIGIIGTMYYWGAIYVITYLFFAIRCLFNQYLSVIYKAIIFSFLICSPIAGFLWEINGFMLQGILFFLCDYNVYKNKLYLKRSTNAP